MKCNDKEIALWSEGAADIEGRLNYRKLNNATYYSQSVFKERWMKLKNNYLFFFKINDLGKIDERNPAAAFILENASIQMENGQSIPFAFSISFIDDPDKRHIFAARCEENVLQWVMKLRQASYEYLRSQLYILQSKIFSLTGKDPLLLVPRNEGSRHWAPAIPFSTASACKSTCYGAGFRCHLHNGNGTIEKSISDLHVSGKKITKEVEMMETSFNEFKISSNANTTNASQGLASVKGGSESVHFRHIERSKTAVIYNEPIDFSIFDNSNKGGLQYTRPAPSPPARAKVSPHLNRHSSHSNVMNISESGKYLDPFSVMDNIPIPPRRKVSPRRHPDASSSVDSINNSEQQPIEKDLIEF